MTSGLRVIGVDTGCTSLSDADHLVRELAPPAAVFGCTHLIRGGHPHIALSFALPSEDAYEAFRSITARQAGTAFGALREGPADLAAGAERAAAEHATRTAGRAVLFPGVAALTGTLTVGELSAASAVDEVVALGAPGAVDPGGRLVTRDHVRPEWREGRLALTVMSAVGGSLVPFEAPDPTPCCADHK
ncbi:hypothetical protein [Streptomyces sp. NBC_01481]|uniref:hypothetical protein n=1 Tax=Streptomyces sp. NBC_01481 TaxID=2975869 RepID=UPI00225B49C4|nr:hypothetical protein [Streptomyces sp. NBC_01481]MCX4581943.1 hypothetical protein [Streptomyces sp. NBC_01481]